jgi:hypothetical protein
MKSTKIYTSDEPILHSSFPNNCANLKDILVDTPEVIESFSGTKKSTNTNTSAKSFNLKKNTGKPVDCKPKKKYYSKKYNHIDILRDIGNFWIGKLDTPDNIKHKGCIGTVEEKIIKNKINLINNINAIIIKYIFIIASFLYLFKYSVTFGGGDKSIIIKLIFSIGLIFVGPLYLTWVCILIILHELPFTSDYTKFFFKCIQWGWVKICLLIPEIMLTGNSYYYLFGQGTALTTIFKLPEMKDFFPK